MTELIAAISSSSSSSLASEIIGYAVLVYVLYLQRQKRALKTKLMLPLILVALGLSSVISSAEVKPISELQMMTLVGLLLFDAIGLGIVRALTVNLWKEDGVLLRQGSWVTVILWIVGVAIHEGALHAVHMNSSSLVLYMGTTLLAQRVTLENRKPKMKSVHN